MIMWVFFCFVFFFCGFLFIIIPPPEKSFRKYWNALKSISEEIFVVTVRYCNWFSEAVCYVEVEPLQSYFID